jgi:hypothetical protein
MKKIIKLLVLTIFLTSCEDVFNPAIENIRSQEEMLKEPAFAQGILANAYVLLPYSSSPNSDLATDDAVSNDITNDYLRMASGSWSANNNPLSQWQDRRNAIQYINLFLKYADDVPWAKDELVSTLFKGRLKGEAYGLRALQMYHLLRAHGGWVNGQLLGVPILTEPEEPGSDFNLPRNTFQECLDQLFADAEEAIKLLPLDYKDITSADIPAYYQNLEGLTPSIYDRVNGKHLKGRITARIVEAIRAQAALLAASPAYSQGTNVTWETAANYAAQVLKRVDGGYASMQANGGTWYTHDSGIDGLASGDNPKEMIWRGDVGQSSTLERNNFPPSLYGLGRVNPTQNLVDAFPMANGYPITDQASGYDPNNPYANRDPRLNKYIIVNESQYKNSTIITGVYGEKDAINRDRGFSTRTGYYMKKLMRTDVNPEPNINTQQKHYVARIRYTELYLAYAEAANEAWGPTGTGTNTFSAYDVIKVIRKRAGIADPDAYLESVKNDKDKMRELIRNERRLELSFENHRFYDLRRWKVDLSQLNETAKGVQISISGENFNYNRIDVEARSFGEHMYYGPIPFEEITKWSQLQQNEGW